MTHPPRSSGALRFPPVATCLIALLITACDNPAEPIPGHGTVDDAPSQHALWREGTVTGWNEITDGLVLHAGLNAVRVARVYGLLSVSQHAAAVSVENFGANAAEIAVAYASADVLTHLFPGRTSDIDRHLRANLRAIPHTPGRTARFRAGKRIGHGVAAHVVDFADTDGSALEWDGENPRTPGGNPTHWEPAPGQTPVEPRWAEITPWHMSSAGQFRPPTPPAIGTAEFEAELDIVRYWFKNRGQREFDIITLWSGPPARRWNEIARQHIRAAGLDALSSARLLAAMNTGMQDAGINAWDCKFHYRVPRPPQVDPENTGAPNGLLPAHPAYTSGLSAFSGAASTVLADAFPDHTATFGQMADEAAMSRVYSNIHYRMDGEAGLAAGRNIGELALEQSDALAARFSVR